MDVPQFSKDWALTAAHCVRKQNHQISSNSLCSAFIVAGEKNQRVKVCDMKVHPLYDTEGQDLALLKLCESVDFITPIALAPPELDIWKYGTTPPNVTTAGWGRMEHFCTSNTLRAITIQIIKYDECIKAYKNAPKFDIDESILKSISLNNTDWSNPSKHYLRICAGNADNPSLNVKHVGPGDSGGPLWWKDEATQQIFQVGLKKIMIKLQNSTENFKIGILKLPLLRFLGQ